ncbi:MAG: dihydrofolate reductase, partial [Ramlibacter sp.]
AWVIGGGEIYRLAMDRAEIIEVTELDADFEGDTLAPQLGPQWIELEREEHVAGSGMRFAFVTYGRGKASE